ncbi:MAG TPA: ferredoxin family protein [Clostridia bacterium]|nr:ferredoxin family protein [Clostridia bacterium]
MPRGTVKIDEERCKGCGLCVAFCPNHALTIDDSRINSSGYHPAALLPDRDCTGCAVCALMCPDVAITVFRIAGKGVTGARPTSAKEAASSRKAVCG